MDSILLTGGMGYIGSHTAVVLIESGYEVVLYDNLSNSKISVLDYIEEITGMRPYFTEGDIRDKETLKRTMIDHSVGAVIHFAGLKAVGESVSMPLEYYDNNIYGSLALCEAMCEVGVKKIVFSSSATVYGDPHTVPIQETFPLSVTNPYGRSKLFIEELLQDIHRSDPEWNVALLRYFNPVGAHKSGKIGDNPNGIPNNLMPYISQVATGKLESLSVFGGDYPTYDGTGVRDYIHVVDLARGHLKAVEKINEVDSGVLAVNLGTGVGYSVLEMVKAFEKASGRVVNYHIVGRREGDIAQCYADPSYAKKLLRWEAELGVEEMCIDSWKFIKEHDLG
jgi:UDP-glucose 4-epimerase